jgi:hypothetical protein
MAARNRPVDPAVHTPKASAVYVMRVAGAALMAMERGLYINPAGQFLRAKAHVRPGEATLEFRVLADRSTLRGRLARWLLGI